VTVRQRLRRLTRPLTTKIPRVYLDQFIRQHGSSGLTLDLGASTGPYRALFPNRIGVDIERAAGVDVVADAHALAFRDQSFDVVVSTEMLEHLREPQRAANEMFRVLRPGGTLVLTTRFLFPLHDAPHDYFRYTKYGLQHLFRQFQIVEIREETDTMGTLAVLVQRLGVQAETLGWRPFGLGWHLLAHVMKRFSFLITREYGDTRERRTAQQMMTSGYYVVCRRPDGPPPPAV
jgi:predicted SAM-dependent methyltransferase